MKKLLFILLLPVLLFGQATNIVDPHTVRGNIISSGFIIGDTNLTDETNYMVAQGANLIGTVTAGEASYVYPEINCTLSVIPAATAANSQYALFGGTLKIPDSNTKALAGVYGNYLTIVHDKSQYKANWVTGSSEYVLVTGTGSTSTKMADYGVGNYPYIGNFNAYIGKAYGVYSIAMNEATAAASTGAKVDSMAAGYFDATTGTLQAKSALATKLHGLTTRIVTYGTGGATVTTGSAHGLEIKADFGANTTTTNYYGVKIRGPKITGTVTNAYGLYIGNVTGAGTLNYSIYSAGGKMYHAGDVQIVKTYWRTTPINVRVPKLPSSNPPGESTEDEFPTLDFDNDTEEQCYYTWNIPQSYATGDSIVLDLDWFTDGATTEDSVIFAVQFKKIAYGDVVDFGSGTTTVTKLISLGAADAKDLRECELGLSAAAASGSWVHSDIILMRIYRDADVVNDNRDSDARVLASYIKFKSKIGL